jgi:hypothetical protein
MPAGLTLKCESRGCSIAILKQCAHRFHYFIEICEKNNRGAMPPINVMMFSGAFLVVATTTILLFRKSYIDAATGGPIEFEMPVVGKLRTQSPVVAVAFLGAGLLMYGVSHSQEDTLTVTGEIKSSEPVTVYIVGIPQFQYTQQNSGPFSTSIPYLPDTQYRAEYVVNGKVLTEKYLKVNGREANLDVFENLVTTPAAEPMIEPKVEASDAAVRQFLSKK